eukprot:CAMPEP_0198124334 /NCGR_PEP_ID=MMETSP1442-20131203/39697_1 /TAXON_ID= /ORGANISM="Craspedostauros australis, Strain CCMP3328" /LENGTH=559 /DNA_ID=CAMNT_0043783717 /DNA_START=312 /DNA_END=1991 /DNA_ORIENTATION=+
MKFFDLITSEEATSVFHDGHAGASADVDVDVDDFGIRHPSLKRDRNKCNNDDGDNEDDDEEEETKGLPVDEEPLDAIGDPVDGESCFLDELSQWLPRQSNKRTLDGRHAELSSGDTARHPTIDLDLTEAEKMQAREIQELSLYERERVYEDIHGVRRPIEEMEEFRHDCLQRLETELTTNLYDSKRKYNVPNSNSTTKDAYTMAAFLAPRITSDVRLRIAMLRSTFWDVEQAANKIMRYFHCKRELFGREKYLYPITFADLSVEARESLEDGAVACHEGGGSNCARSMLVDRVARWKEQSALSRAQAIFYLTHVSNTTVQSQQHGQVVVIYALDADSSHFRRALAMMKIFWLEDMPFRMAGLHVCISNHRIKTILSSVLQVIPKTSRIRCRIHCGSPVECNYELLTYGIPPGLLPDTTQISYDSAITNEMIGRFLRHDREVLDEYFEGKSEDCMDQPPKPKDILLGRGRPYQRYPGNVEFAKLLEANKAAYDQPSMMRRNKTAMTKGLVQQLRDSDVQFLKHDESGNWWVEVSDSVARKRVAMSFRNLSRNLKHDEARS